jgi:hypothetical protein
MYNAVCMYVYTTCCCTASNRFKEGWLVLQVIEVIPFQAIHPCSNHVQHLQQHDVVFDILCPVLRSSAVLQQVYIVSVQCVPYT